MKTIFLMLACVAGLQKISGQLKTTAPCPPFVVDILEGNVNDLFSYSTPAEFENRFPCYSSTVPETNGSTCGGVFFKDRDIYFFTERDYIEIGENFKGKISLPVLGAKRGSLFAMLGYPAIKDANWDAYQTKYGILILYVDNAGNINKLRMSNKNAETIKLCE